MYASMGCTPLTNDAQQYSGDWTWTPNSTWVNDFRLGYVFIRNITRIAGDDNLLPSNPWPNGYGMNTGVTNPLYGGFPSVKFTSFTGSLGGGGTRTSRRGPQGDVDLVDSVSYLRGKHAFKFGFEYLDMSTTATHYTDAQGAVNFTTLESFLQGTPNEWSRFYWAILTRTRGCTGIGVFVQDDWRINAQSHLEPRSALRILRAADGTQQLSWQLRSERQSHDDSGGSAIRPGRAAFFRIQRRVGAISRRAWAWPGTSEATGRPWSAPEAAS